MDGLATSPSPETSILMSTLSRAGRTVLVLLWIGLLAVWLTGCVVTAGPVLPPPPTPDITAEKIEVISPVSLAKPTNGSPIQVISSKTVNRFPEELIFEVTAASSAGQVERIELVFGLRGGGPPIRQPLEIARPTSTVTVSYSWQTQNLTVPPGAPVTFRWEVRDSYGHKAVTEPLLVYFDDVRFPWQHLENEQVAVFWYAGQAEFGQGLFHLADQVLERLTSEVETRLPYQVRIIVYPTQEAFFSAFPRMQEWIAGRAFPELSLTVQVIPPVLVDDRWQKSVLAHELAHLFNYQAMYSPLNIAPHWLDEGLATYAEPVDHPELTQILEEAVQQQTLLPLEYLTGSFGNDQDRATLAYAQSLSMVQFALGYFGSGRMAQLLTGLREGRRVNEAFVAAFGLDQRGFYDYWREVTIAAVSGQEEPTPPAAARLLPAEQRRGYPYATPPAVVSQGGEPSHSFQPAP